MTKKVKVWKKISLVILKANLLHQDFMGVVTFDIGMATSANKPTTVITL